MRRSFPRLLALAWASIGMLVVAPAARAAEAWFLTPEAGAGIYGPVDFSVHVETDEVILAVEFFVDDVSIGFVTQPPYALVWDVGYENREHALRAEARLEGGERVIARRRTGSFKVHDSLEIELRQLYVNVMAEGQRVQGLRRDDFRILDGGEPEKIVTFEHGDIPVTAVLLLDCSRSMKGERFAAAMRGARTFVDRMAPLDEAKILLFSDRLLAATPFTRDREVLAAVLEGAAPVGGTAINDYLFAGLKMLDGRQGRRVVVLFTDGVDLHSLLSMRDVLWKAQRSQAVVYWIFLRPEEDTGPPQFATALRGFEDNLEEFRLLRRAVAQSGGRIAELNGPEELEGAFAEIMNELRQQYVLGYYPSYAQGDGRWREVDVKVRGVGARVRTRLGYIDD